MVRRPKAAEPLFDPGGSEAVESVKNGVGPGTLQALGVVGMGDADRPHPRRLGRRQTGQAVLDDQAVRGGRDRPGCRPVAAEGVESEQVALGVGLAPRGVLGRDDRGDPVAAGRAGGGRTRSRAGGRPSRSPGASGRPAASRPRPRPGKNRRPASATARSARPCARSARRYAAVAAPGPRRPARPRSTRDRRSPGSARGRPFAIAIPSSREDFAEEVEMDVLVVDEHAVEVENHRPDHTGTIPKPRGPWLRSPRVRARPSGSGCSRPWAG